MLDLPPEPGLDRHEWETEYEQLLPLLETDPEESLPDLASLLERMLQERSLAVDDEVVVEKTEPIASFAPAMDQAERARAGDDLPPGDVAFAIRELRELDATLIGERRAP